MKVRCSFLLSGKIMTGALAAALLPLASVAAQADPTAVLPTPITVENVCALNATFYDSPVVRNYTCLVGGVFAGGFNLSGGIPKKKFNVAKCQSATDACIAVLPPFGCSIKPASVLACDASLEELTQCTGELLSEATSGSQTFDCSAIAKLDRIRIKKPGRYKRTRKKMAGLVETALSGRKTSCESLSQECRHLVPDTEDGSESDFKKPDGHDRKGRNNR